MSKQVNDFFDSATPAQINQMHIEKPQEQEPTPQHHPAIAAGIGSFEDLPVPEVEEVAAQPDVEVKQNEPSTVQEVPVEVKESPQQMRFRELREAKLRAEWERDELTRRLQAIENSDRPRAIQTKQVEEEDFEIAPDEIIEGKHVLKIIKAERQRSERQMKQQHAQMMNMMMENRLKSELPDLDSVVTTENARKLQQLYPEIANTLLNAPDEYTKLKSAYTIIKKLNISPVDSVYDYEADKRKIQQNMAKPRAVQSVTPRQSALAQAGSYDGELTDSLKAQLWKEMNTARNK